jgi:hypothetical protein
VPPKDKKEAVATARRWQKRNPERVLAYKRTRYFLETIRDRRKSLGLSLARQLFLWSHQAGKCAICAAEIKFTSAHLDHCHATGRIRGFLCRFCNVGIGQLKDSVALLRRAVFYLEDRCPSPAV